MPPKLPEGPLIPDLFVALAFDLADWGVAIAVPDGAGGFWRVDPMEFYLSSEELEDARNTV